MTPHRHLLMNTPRREAFFFFFFFFFFVHHVHPVLPLHDHNSENVIYGGQLRM